MSVSKAFMNAFDRMGSQGDKLTLIEEHTRGTKEAVAVGGDLYSRIDHMAKALDEIRGAKGGTKNAIAGAANAMAVALVAPAMEPIGKGFQLIVEAVNNLEGSGKEIKEKIEALTGGLVLLGDVGKSILLFAGYLVLATPLLLIAAMAAPLIGITLWAVTTAVTMATKNVTKESMEKLESLQKVGFGILTIMGAMALSSLIIVPALKGALVSAVVIGIIGLVFTLMPEKALESMKKASDSLLMLGLGILTLMVTFALTSLIIAPALKGAMVAAGLILVIGGVFYLLETMGVIDKIEDGAKGLLYAAGAILGLGIALALFNIITPPLPVLLNVALVVGSVALMFGLVGLFEKQIYKGARALLWASLSIVVLGLAIKLFSVLTGGMDISLETFAPLLLIGAIGVVMAVAGVAAKMIEKGAIAMILAGVSLISIAVGMFIMKKALGENGWELLGQTAALVIGLGLAMAGAGAAAAFIAPGAAAMILAGGALIAIGAGMMILKKLNFKEMTKRSGILGDSGKKSKGFLGIGGGRPKTNMEVMFEAIAVSFMLNPLHIAAMYAGAPALIMAGVALVSIGAGIKSFQKIAETADLPKLGANVNMIVSALADTFARVGREYPGGGTGIIGALFGGGGGSVVAQGISAVSGMGRALKGIAKGVQAMAELKFPTGFDKEGNATGYETINLTDAVPKLITNTQLIVSGLSSVFAEVGESKAAQGSTWFTSSAYEKGIKVVKKMGEPLANLATGVQNMANLKFPTGYDKEGNATGYKSIGNVGGLVKKLTKNTKAIIQGLASVFEDIGKGDAAKTKWFSKNTFEKGIAVANKLGEPYQNLAAAVENVTKITGKIKDAQEVKDKVQAMISSITGAGGEDAGLIRSKSILIATIGKAYERLGVAIPNIVTAIQQFTVEKGKAFASIFGGESPAELFEQKTQFLRGLSRSYMRMAVAIPMIVGSINSVSAENMDSFTYLYGGKMNDAEMLKTKTVMFVAAGKSYERAGQAIPAITSAISQSDPEKIKSFKGLFIGNVSALRPVKGYQVQTELWNAIGTNMSATATAFPSIADGINSMDLSKLTETRQMFEALAVLAEGGESPEDILEAMGESLSTALENLTQMIETFRTTVETGNAETGSVLEGVASTVGGAVGAFRDAAFGGGGGDNTQVVNAVRQLHKALISSGIKIKNIDDLT